jgi:hypothetical protein
MKGQFQTLARSESERDSAVWVGEPASEGEAQHRNPGRGWRWEGGKSNARDRGRPRRLRRGPTSPPEPVRQGESQAPGAAEGSERLIVARKPAERREE